MSFHFENTAAAEIKEMAAMEAFVSFAKLKKEDAFSKVEESFAKRMKAADVKMLKLIVSIPAPKTYEYSVTPAKLDKDDFKFVWQLLKGTNSYKEGLPKWNICTITVNSGKIMDVKFQLSPVLLKKFQAKMPKFEKGTETLDLVEDLIELQASYEGLDTSIKELDSVDKLMDNVRIATEAAKIGDFNVALQVAGVATENFMAANVDAALEGLGDAAKAAWEKFKAAIAKIIEWIKNAIRTCMEGVKKLIQLTPVYRKIYEASYNSAKKKGMEQYDKEFVNTVIDSGAIVLIKDKIGEYRNAINLVVDDLCKCTKLMSDTGGDDDASGKQVANYWAKFENTDIFKTLSTGRLFFKSQGDPSQDTWAHLGYNTPSEIFAEIESVYSMKGIAEKLQRSCIDVLEGGIRAFGEKEIYSDVKDSFRKVLKYATEMSKFFMVAMAVANKTLTQAGKTNKTLRDKFGITDADIAQQPEQPAK